ncbi:MAG TPA: cbb3-type cytochrome c oxidase subunit 3 [Burkholderiaceae bacterium]|nr:cbb3-type cytochrome c oxidase subunit 3 [Burkholderiaceae bacterium]
MMGVITGIVTALALLTFLGIVWWAFSAGRKKANEEAASLPFLVEDETEAVDDDARQQTESPDNTDIKREESHE